MELDPALFQLLPTGYRRDGANITNGQMDELHDSLRLTLDDLTNNHFNRLGLSETDLLCKIMYLLYCICLARIMFRTPLIALEAPACR